MNNESKLPVPPDAPWIFSNSKPRELRFRNANADDIDTKDDFGSYKKFNLGLPDSDIASHVLMPPQSAIYARLLKATVLKYSASPKVIADMGSGVGFVAAALHEEFSKSEVDGYEISFDGTEAAKKNYPGVNWHCACIEPGVPLARSYDFIHAREFYPFTRTSSADFCLGYLRLFAHHLEKDGLIVVNLIDKENCLYQALPAVIKDLDKLGLMFAGKKSLPSLWLYQWIRVLPLSRLLTGIFRKIFSRNTSYFLIFQKKSDVNASTKDVNW